MSNLPLPTKAEIEAEFAGTNFGTIDPEKVLHDCLEKTALGYAVGSTIKRIAERLQLVTVNQAGEQRLTQKGLAYLMHKELAPSAGLPMAPLPQTPFETMNDTINDKQSTEDGGAGGKPVVMGSPFQGSEFKQVGPVVLGCISPEARDLLDKIMEEWDKHLVELKKAHGSDYTPTHYGFAYWLVRWSGLVRPSDCP